MAGGGLLHLWSEWGIQIMVLASFALQLLLLACGGTRRRSSSTLLRIVLWLAYLSADSTAIYTLGHLSVTSSSHEHLLVAFWAPFLLLHLGGPDNITAYALEDNRLWLRHLQTLVVQALGAAYVLYKFIFSARSHDGTLLLLAASISMFAAGLAKYGERVWALKCGNISSITSSFDESVDKVRDPEPLNRLSTDGGEIDNEEILLRAHSHFDICKATFTDATVNRDPSDRSEPNVAQLYKLVEMELSLMYDILYTKAAVIHTWYGFCIHFISMLGTVAALQLFEMSIGSSGDGYNRVDLITSYVLLAGALVLEAMSLCKAILSTWTCSFLYRSGWKRLLHLITYLRRRVRPARRRLSSGSIGQYNLLHLSTSDRNGIVYWLVKKAGLEGWWTKLPNFSGTQFCSVEDLKEFMLKEMTTGATGVKPRRSYLDNLEGGDGEYMWSIDSDLDKSILVWHMVTDLTIITPHRKKEKVSKGLVEATKVLSNYMMYLLVVKPDMLPGRTRRNVHQKVCKELVRCWKDNLKKHGSLGVSESRTDKLGEWFSDDLEEPPLRKIFDRSYCINPETGYGQDGMDTYETILGLCVGVFRDRNTEAGWLKLFRMWVQIMMYVAEQCSRDSHARQLGQGGEFITNMWLMLAHLKYYSLLQENNMILEP